MLPTPQIPTSSLHKPLLFHHYTQSIDQRVENFQAEQGLVGRQYSYMLNSDKCIRCTMLFRRPTGHKPENYFPLQRSQHKLIG